MLWTAEHVYQVERDSGKVQVESESTFFQSSLSYQLSSHILCWQILVVTSKSWNPLLIPDSNCGKRNTFFKPTIFRKIKKVISSQFTKWFCSRVCAQNNLQTCPIHQFDKSSSFKISLKWTLMKISVSLMFNFVSFSKTGLWWLSTQCKHVASVRLEIAGFSNKFS